MILVLLGVSIFEISYANETLQHGRSWNNVTININPKQYPNWHFYLENSLRFFSNDNTFFDENQDIAGIGYSILKNTVFWIAYQHNQFYNDNYENRVWYQFTSNLIDNEELKLISRSRIEQRMEKIRPKTVWRFRQRVTVQFPIDKNENVQGVVYDELFLNLNQPKNYNIYFMDQNRFFTGLQFPVCDKTQLVLGYLNQYVLRRPFNRMNHVMFTQLIFNFG